MIELNPEDITLQVYHLKNYREKWWVKVTHVPSKKHFELSLGREINKRINMLVEQLILTIQEDMEMDEKLKKQKEIINR